MRRRRSPLVVVVFGVLGVLGALGGLGLLGAVGTGAAQGVGCGKTMAAVPLLWETDIDVAFARAKRENKLVLVYFGASWDTAAKELEVVTFVDPQVSVVLWRDFVTLHVDSTDDEDPNTRKLQERFKVIGDPTMIVMAADGRSEILRYNEFVPPETFVRALQKATRPDAIREARFEATVRKRAAEAYWEEERRKADLAPSSVFNDFIPSQP
jgi:thiol:disulfide interchange protein